MPGQAYSPATPNGGFNEPPGWPNADMEEGEHLSLNKRNMLKVST